MTENPYQSPIAIDVKRRRNGWTFERPFWGRLTLAWSFSYLFASVWLIGSVSMYLLLLGIWILREGTIPNSIETPPEPYYSWAGVASFGTCTLAAMIAGWVMIYPRIALAHETWPNWRIVLRYLSWSTVIMGPVWVAVAWASEAIFCLPGESEWIGIALIALLGIAQGYICQQGLRYQWTEIPTELKLGDHNSSPDGKSN